MYIAALIGSISAFVCAFVPLLGIPFTLVFSITAIVFSILVFKKGGLKERKDASIISLIISIIAILICLIINILSINVIRDIIEDFKYENSIDYDSYYEQKFGDYKEYNLDDKLISDNEVIISVEDYYNDGNEYYASLNVESLQDDNYVSVYDFIIYDEKNNEYYYTSSTGQATISKFLDEGESIELFLKFELDDEEEYDNLYLIFMDYENGIKIKI